MIDMSKTIIAKSDQLNADDLLGGPRILLVTTVVETGKDDQPIAIHYQGDDGKPYKPNLGMRRALCLCWGNDAEQYAGREIEVYCHSSVTWAGQKVGGIRIKALSDITERKHFSLTIKRGRKEPITIEPIVSLRGRFDACEDMEALRALWGSLTAGQQQQNEALKEAAKARLGA